MANFREISRGAGEVYFYGRDGSIMLYIGETALFDLDDDVYDAYGSRYISVSLNDPNGVDYSKINEIVRSGRATPLSSSKVSELITNALSLGLVIMNR